MNLDSFKKPVTQCISTLLKGLRAIDTPSQDVGFRPHFVDVIELEARVLYSASPLTTDLVDAPEISSFEPNVDPLEIGTEPNDFSIPAEHKPFFAADEIDFDALLTEPNTPSAHVSEIVFIDSGVANIEQIAGEFHGVTNVEVIILRAEDDGVAQISAALSGRQSIDSVHIISHGSAGRLQLGATTLSNDNLNHFADEIAGWSQALDQEADILFYGCNLAASFEGRDFVEELSQLTEADIAASDDITGHTRLGGDWDLEFVQGQVSTQIIASQTLQEAWESALAAPPLDGSGAIWLTTHGEANADSGPNWDEQDIIQFGDPNLELESPDTDGTFEATGFTMPTEIRGIHLVESPSVTVGDTTVQRGDLLLALGSNHDFGSFDADRSDIVLFRPDSLTDYSSGTYHMFLDEAVHSGGGAKNIHGLSLIESDVDVGGHTLREGSLVVARSSGGDKDLFVVDVNTTSMGSSGFTDTENEQLLIDGSGGGSSLDIDKKIEGVEVLEKAITIGGRALSAGTILVSFDTTSAQDILAGSGNVSANGQDIVALDVHQTEFDGNTDATPSLFFNGSDVGLNNGNERIYGISVISPAIASVDHAVTVDTTDDVVDGNTASISTLLADRGADGRISLREAIEAANNTNNDGSNPDQILFDIQNDDSGHVYYRDDGIANSLSNIATTTLSDAAITDFDPDYPFAQHSWFQINLDNSLPELTITDSVSIDGYSQSGSSENTLSIGHNATLRIELTNLAANNVDLNMGLRFGSGADQSSLRGLVINEFGSDGVRVNGGVHGVSIQGNFIGTDVTGTVDRGNRDEGIQIDSNNNQIGGSRIADRNIISGNNDKGIAIFGNTVLSGNVIENNYIGVNSTGLEGLGNSSFGVVLYENDGTSLIDNVISGNLDDGIRLRSGEDIENTIIQGNRIGTGADGTTQVGNSGVGIRINADNASNILIGGTGAGQGNVISGNSGHGISYSGNSVSNTQVFGNFIGTDATGTISLGNAGDGIHLGGPTFDNQIGGVSSGQANIIANNAGNGVNFIDTGTAANDGTSIRGNQFFDNGKLAIDILDDGVTANDYTTPISDEDFGPNRVQNFPDINSAELIGTDLAVAGELFGNANSDYIIDFYATGSPDSTGHGEAVQYLGSIQRTTNSVGYTSFSNIFNSVSVTVGESITATATHSDGSTSEFSANQLVATTINNSPTATTPPDSDVDEDSADLFFDLDAIFDDIEDADADLVYSIENVTNPGLFDIATINGSRQLHLDLAEHQNGTSMVTVRATDTGGAFTDAILRINVAPENDAPVVDTPINTHVVAEDAPQSILSLLTTFSDIEDSTLTYSVVSVSDNSLLNAEIAGSELMLDYQADQYGIADVVVRATDSGGSHVDHTIMVTVDPVNDVPMVSDKLYTLDDTGTITGNLLVDASDVEGDSLQATLVTAPSHGTVVLRPNGTFVYTPNEGFSGTDSFQFVATDGSGLSTTATAEVDVLPTPPPPPTPSVEDNSSEEEETVVENILPPTPNTADDRENDAELPKQKTRTQEAAAFNLPEAQSFNKVVLNHERHSSTGTMITHVTNLDEVTAPEVAFSVQSNLLPTQLYTTLASFSDDVAAATNSINYAFVNSIVSASGFSIVAATWILRSGALLASMMANLPAWRVIDPLVVLGYSHDEIDGNESLHDIIESGSAEEHTPHEEDSSQSPHEQTSRR